MNYKTGDFYLFKDQNYKANQFIGEIIEESNDDLYKLIIYIFPEDTKYGRQHHNSQYEVFLTPSQFLYNFEKKPYKKVEIVKLQEYIYRKYTLNEKLKLPLYFFRQAYLLEKNIFNPERLPLECYCQEIFNPDIPFQKCICGNIFHLNCLIQSTSSKCWSKDCNFNCNELLNEEQKIEKATIISKINDVNSNKTIKNKEIDIDIDKNQNNILNKKTKREKNQNEEEDNKNKIKFNNINNYSEPQNSKLYLNKQNSQTERKIQIIGEKNFNNNINRNKGIDLIHNVLLEGLKILTNNCQLLEKYNKYQNTEIYNYIKSKNELFSKFYLKQFSEKIEKYLFDLYKNNSSSYFTFLQDFNKCKNDSQDLLIKIILGEYKPEQISKFKEDDFLSEEQKKLKEEKKKSEINKMLLKNDDKEIKLTLNKGTMLSQQEIFYDDKNNDNQYMESETNFNSRESFESNKLKEYNEKIREKQKQFPNLKIEDIKLLISLKDPNRDYIEKKLNQLIQDNFEINEQHYFFEKRNIILDKEAKKIIKKNIKQNNENKNNDNIINLIDNNQIEQIIEDISLDINYL